jgi:uncharacterized protein
MPALDVNPAEVDLKTKSPYDAENNSARPIFHDLVQITLAPAAPRWMPSQFNCRTTDHDGSLIVWNTKSGAMSVFSPQQKAAVEHYLSRKGHPGELDKLGEYLRERGFIVTDNAHEYRQFQTIFGQQHYRTDTLQLILLASEDCNFRCTYCYEDFKRGTMYPSVRKAIKALVEKRAKQLTSLGVSWFGGEPLYGWEAIEDLGPFFARMVEDHGWHYSSSMTTNGYLLTRERAVNLFAWKCRNFQITVDGLGPQHDAHRPARDGSPTFQTIFSNLKALKEMDEDFFVRLRINFDHETQPYLEDFLSLLEKHFSNDKRYGIALYAVGKWGGENDDNLDVCGIGEARDVRAELNSSAASKGLNFATVADRTQIGGQVCYAARPYNFVIGADGKVMKCTVVLDKDDYNIVGDLKEDGEINLDYERFSKWVEPAYEQDKSCRSCYLLPSCQGLSCPYIRFETQKSPCDATVKHNLHNELVDARAAKQLKAKIVQLKAAVPHATAKENYEQR